MIGTQEKPIMKLRKQRKGTIRMSKIGNYNMELEEEFRDQLNGLGFETLQDALNAGWEVYDGELVRQKDLSNEAYEQAQKDWEKEKEEVIESLDNILRGVMMPLEWAGKLVDAIEFIKKARF